VSSAARAPGSRAWRFLVDIGFIRRDLNTTREASAGETPTDIETALETMHALKLEACDGIGLSPVATLPAKIG
jgi:hypothetical protein